MIAVSILILLFVGKGFALNFDWERDQLPSTKYARPHVTPRQANAAAPKGCKVVPGDDAWPSDDDWTTFNATLGGVLLKPKPLASVCYTGPDFNAARCEQLKSSWAAMSIQ